MKTKSCGKVTLRNCNGPPALDARVAVNALVNAVRNAAPINVAQESRMAVPVNAMRRAQSALEPRFPSHLNAALDFPIPLSHTNFLFSHSTSSSSDSAFIPVACLSLDSFTVHGFEVFNSSSTSSIGLGPL